MNHGVMKLKIIRKFILGTAFEHTWKDLGLNDDDLRRLQTDLLENPKAGSVIRGTGRMRKLRFAYENRGKSGSSRVCYVDFEDKEIIYLLAMFSKNQQENLTKAECNILKKKIDMLEKKSVRGK